MMANIAKNTIEKIAKKVSFIETEDEDLFYYENLSIKERLTELLEWNKKIWIQINGVYPGIIEKVGGKFIKSSTDEDDF